MNPVSLHHYLVVSAVLFAIGLAGVLCRRNAIAMLIGVELMLNAANLNLIAFWRFAPEPGLAGPVFVLFSIAIAAAEVAVGLALAIAWYRHTRSTDLDTAGTMQG
jgi:NADH-quinone oxidoreductase subunit K